MMVIWREDLTYRPLYRAVYVIQGLRTFIEVLDLSPTISGCLHAITLMDDDTNVISLIAHYIGLSTKSPFECFLFRKDLIAHYIGLSTTIFSVAFH